MYPVIFRMHYLGHPMRFDAYIAERKQKELEAKQKHEQYVKAQEKRERRKQYEELKKEFEKA